MKTILVVLCLFLPLGCGQKLKIHLVPEEAGSLTSPHSLTMRYLNAQSREERKETLPHSALASSNEIEWPAFENHEIEPQGRFEVQLSDQYGKPLFSGFKEITPAEAQSREVTIRLKKSKPATERIKIQELRFWNSSKELLTVHSISPEEEKKSCLVIPHLLFKVYTASSSFWIGFKAQDGKEWEMPISLKQELKSFRNKQQVQLIPFEGEQWSLSCVEINLEFDSRPMEWNAQKTKGYFTDFIASQPESIFELEVKNPNVFPVSVNIEMHGIDLLSKTRLKLAYSLTEEKKRISAHAQSFEIMENFPVVLPKSSQKIKLYGGFLDSTFLKKNIEIFWVLKVYGKDDSNVPYELERVSQHFQL